MLSLDTVLLYILIECITPKLASIVALNGLQLAIEFLLPINMAALEGKQSLILGSQKVHLEVVPMII